MNVIRTNAQTFYEGQKAHLVNQKNTKPRSLKKAVRIVAITQSQALTIETVGPVHLPAFFNYVAGPEISSETSNFWVVPE